ncbi:MAG: NUDIX hydrolase [Phycisphaerae bacterium]|nr:NUDIX hydrolase [Phycisphaerae bacterium]
MVAKGYEVGVRMDDGKVVRRDYLHYDGAAVILPVRDDGSIVMIRNYRFAVDENLLELPAGMLSTGEPPEVCAARELTEETGYKAQKVEKLGQFYTGPGTSNQILHSFLATGLTEGAQNLEEYERITVESFSQAQIRRMIAGGEIHDAKTISTLSLYWLRGQ